MHKMKLEACYARSRVVMGIVEQSGSEQKDWKPFTRIIGLLRA